MKHPCVELYFDLETTDANIRIWIKTDDKLVFGALDSRFFERAQQIRTLLIQHTHMPVSFLTALLEQEDGISAFQIGLREDWKNLATVVYKEWP